MRKIYYCECGNVRPGHQEGCDRCRTLNKTKPNPEADHESKLWQGGPNRMNLGRIQQYVRAHRPHYDHLYDYPDNDLAGLLDQMND